MASIPAPAANVAKRKVKRASRALPILIKIGRAHV